MDVMFWVWLGVVVVTAIIEFATLDLTSIWFTAGAVIPFILSAFKAVSWEIQVIIFLCVSAVLIICLRRVTKNLLLKNAKEKTNMDSLIGKEFRLLSRCDFETAGTVKIHGVIWSAIPANNKAIEKDDIVEIVRIDGNKLLVQKTENQQPKKEDA